MATSHVGGIAALTRPYDRGDPIKVAAPTMHELLVARLAHNRPGRRRHQQRHKRGGANCVSYPYKT
ncbi:MAG: hypothetical protein ACT4PT_02165 [Methanobacteriota archaeon]